METFWLDLLDGAYTHESLQSPQKDDDIKLKNGGFHTLNANPDSSEPARQLEESAPCVDGYDVNELFQQIASLKRELFEEKQRRSAAEEASKHLSAKLVQVQLRMDREIRERDEKYSELETKFITLHKRALKRIQEEVDKEKDDTETVQFRDANDKAEEASSWQLSSLQHECDRTRMQADSEAFKAMDSERQQLITANNNSIMDDSGPQSLFVVLDYGHYKEVSSIIQLEAQVNKHEYVARFSQPQGRPSIDWTFSHLASSTEDLYMLPDIRSRNHVPLRGFNFNLRTKKCKPIKPPRVPKYDAHVVTLGRHIYFIARPYRYSDAPDPFFERYNPDNDSWETLEPFPRHDIDRSGNDFVATAVWKDTILLNLGGYEFWAYNVGRNKWYPVNVRNNWCYSIEREAVVVENTIYSLSNQCNESVLALSITREDKNGDLVFKCSLRSRISVPDMFKTTFEYGETHWWTKHLVHLGKDNFCLVQSCQRYGMSEYQPIQVTYLKLKEEKKSMTVTNICVHHLRNLDNHQFKVGHCFSLPKCKTTTLKGGGKRSIRIDLDAFLEDYEPRRLGTR